MFARLAQWQSLSLQWIDSHAAVIQAVSALAVAVLTYFLVSFTRRYVKRTEEALKLSADQAISNEKQFAEQLKVARDAATAAQQSADAAKLNAVAFMNAERAWLEVKLIQRGPAIYQLEATNYGRTPAKVTEYYFRQEFPPSILQLPSPDRLYGTRIDGITSHTKLLAPHDPWLFESLNLATALGEDIMQKVRAQQIALVYYGALRYKDIADQLHETTFCYSYSVSEGSLMPVNDPAYHKYT